MKKLYIAIAFVLMIFLVSANPDTDPRPSFVDISDQFGQWNFSFTHLTNDSDFTTHLNSTTAPWFQLGINNITFTNMPSNVSNLTFFWSRDCDISCNLGTDGTVTSTYDFWDGTSWEGMAAVQSINWFTTKNISIPYSRETLTGPLMVQDGAFSVRTPGWDSEGTLHKNASIVEYYINYSVDNTGPRSPIVNVVNGSAQTNLYDNNSININVNASEDFKLHPTFGLFYSLNGGANTSVGSWTANGGNQSVPISSLVSGTNNLLFYSMNDAGAKSSFSPLTFSFSMTGFTENSQDFKANVSETSEESFSVNVSYDTVTYEFISVDLVYNGTRKSATQIGSGTNSLFNVSFDIPLLPNADESETRDFYWEVALTQGATTDRFNSTTKTQNVSRIHLEECNATYTVQTLNFTAFDEGDSSRVNPFYIAADFDFWVGSGSIKRSNSFSNTTATEFGLCVSPTDTNYTVDATIEYNDVINSTTYNTRNYFFQGEEITNVSEDIELFLLNGDDSTSFILKVQDTNLLPVADALIHIQRFDVGTGNFSTVSIAKTDDNGQTVGFFKTETVDYRFIIIKNGVTLLETGSQKVVPETAPFTLTFTVGADAAAPWTRFEDLANLTKSLVFNDSTTNVTFSYIDSSDEFSLGRLLLQNQNLSGPDQTICDINSTSSTATLVCGTGNITGTYIASAFITRGSDVFLVQQIVFKVETFSTTVGMLGVLLGWFIILISAFAFKFNEIAGIVLMNLTVIFINLIGLVNFGYLFIFGMMGISIMIIVLLEK